MPTSFRPARSAALALSSAAARPDVVGIDSSTTVKPFFPAGQASGPVTADGCCGGGGGAAVDVVLVVRSVGVEVGVVVPTVVTVPVRVGPVATIVEPLPFPHVAATTTPVAIAATTRATRAGQIQSPGYHRTRRRQPDERLVTTVRAGSRRPHSRQYSWPGAWGVPQRGHSASGGAGPGGGVSTA